MNADLRNLPLEERIRLVEELWDSIAANQSLFPLTDISEKRWTADWTHMSLMETQAVRLKT
jgi:hypothetical protein